MEERTKNENEKYCAHCGKIININAEVCPECGVRVMAPPVSGEADPVEKHRKWFITMILCWLFGMIGVHRFYNGKIGTGILMIITCGGIGIWWVVDMIMCITGNFKNKEGEKIR